MTYATVAAAAEELAAALRAARSDEAAARRVEALAQVARALGDRSAEEAARAIDEASAQAPAHRMFGTSMADLVEPIGRLRNVAHSLGAKPSALAALASIEDLAEGAAPMDARGVVIGLEALTAREAEEAARADEEKRAKEAAERAVGAAFAERLAGAPATRAALDAVFSEMKAAKPRLPAAAWKEAADRWVRPDETRSARAARAAIEAKISKIAGAPAPLRMENQPMASGF